jgi:hypothetical protein
MREISPIVLLPVGAFSFLMGAAFGQSRRGLSMLKPSPLPGVPLTRWEHFVAVMATAPRRRVTPRRRLGIFGMDARRLADVGFMTNPHKEASEVGGVWVAEWKPPLTTEKFLDSVPAQYAAFTRSMTRMTPRIEKLVGAEVDGARCSLSGLLGVGHLAGEAGVEGWVRDPEVRERFRSTTANFTKTNGIF